VSNPYLAVLATPPRTERFGGLGLIAISAAVSAMLNAIYEDAPLRPEDAMDMVEKGQKPLPFANKAVPAGFGLSQKSLRPAGSLADATIKAANLLGALSRHTLDRRYADKGAQLLNDFNKSPWSVRAQVNEKDPAKISELYAGVLREIEPWLKGRESDRGVQFLLGLMKRQGADDAVRSVQAQQEERKAGAFELIYTEKNQDTCFPGGKEEREAHAKLFAKIPSFLQEADPTASPPNCKQRIKPWVVPTGIGLGVGLAALLLFRRRRPQQTVIMIPGGAAGNSSQALTTR